MEESQEEMDMRNELEIALTNGDVLMNATIIPNTETGQNEYHDIEFVGKTEKGEDLVKRLKELLDKLDEQ